MNDDDMNTDWDLRTLAYLWDPQRGAINAGADRIEALTGTDRAGSLAALGDRVASLASAMDDGWLVSTAYFMVDDLYKSCFHQMRWDEDVEDYIRATAGVVMGELARRDFVLHYVVDNQDSEARLVDLLAAIPLPFGAAGLLVTGPQIMALELMEQVDHRPRAAGAIPRYRAEGQHLADQLIQRCHRERRASVYLNMDLDDDSPPLSLEVPLSAAGTPGAIAIFRNEAPAIGSFAHITPPPGVTLPRG